MKLSDIVESALVNSLVGQQLAPRQLEAISKLSGTDLITEHGLSEIEANQVLRHVKSEIYRNRAQTQSFGSTSPERAKFSFANPPTRTAPVNEGRKSKKISGKQLKALVESVVSAEQYGPTRGSMPLIGIGSIGQGPMTSAPMAQAQQQQAHFHDPNEDLLCCLDQLSSCIEQVREALACGAQPQGWVSERINHATNSLSEAAKTLRFSRGYSSSRR
jgi:hypothetical protein